MATLVLMVVIGVVTTIAIVIGIMRWKRPSWESKRWDETYCLVVVRQWFYGLNRPKVIF